MSIRTKLIAGFLIPALMILTVGFWSSYQIRTFSSGIEKMLQDNDRSIQYALMMNESLLKIDHAVFLKTLGDTAIYSTAGQQEWEKYWLNFDKAKGNITEPGERELVDKIKVLSDSLLNSAEIVTSKDGVVLYLSRFFPLYENTQSEINQLRLLNSEALYHNALSLVEASKRVAIPGDLLVAIAFIFFLLFGWLTHRFISAPLVKILKNLKKYNTTGKLELPNLPNQDELRELAEELNRALKK